MKKLILLLIFSAVTGLCFSQNLKEDMKYAGKTIKEDSKKAGKAISKTSKKVTKSVSSDKKKTSAKAKKQPAKKED